jgi:hypothetical protein
LKFYFSIFNFAAAKTLGSISHRDSAMISIQLSQSLIESPVKPRLVEYSDSEDDDESNFTPNDTSIASGFSQCE